MSASGGPTGNNPSGGLPPCTACRHYFITHEAGYPNGCRLHAIKSRRLPQLDVLAASGEICLGFEPKPLPAHPPRRDGLR